MTSFTTLQYLSTVLWCSFVLCYTFTSNKATLGLSSKLLRILQLVSPFKLLPPVTEGCRPYICCFNSSCWNYSWEFVALTREVAPLTALFPRSNSCSHLVPFLDRTAVPASSFSSIKQLFPPHIFPRSNSCSRVVFFLDQATVPASTVDPHYQFWPVATRGSYPLIRQLPFPPRVDDLHQHLSKAGHGHRKWHQVRPSGAAIASCHHCPAQSSGSPLLLSYAIIQRWRLYCPEPHRLNKCGVSNVEFAWAENCCNFCESSNTVFCCNNSLLDCSNKSNCRNNKTTIEYLLNICNRFLCAAACWSKEVPHIRR